MTKKLDGAELENVAGGDDMPESISWGAVAKAGGALFLAIAIPLGITFGGWTAVTLVHVQGQVALIHQAIASEKQLADERRSALGEDITDIRRDVREISRLLGALKIEQAQGR